jgi:hypothetical protein
MLPPLFSKFRARPWPEKRGKAEKRKNSSCYRIFERENSPEIRPVRKNSRRTGNFKKSKAPEGGISGEKRHHESIRRKIPTFLYC